MSTVSISRCALLCMLSLSFGCVYPKQTLRAPGPVVLRELAHEFRLPRGATINDEEIERLGIVCGSSLDFPCSHLGDVRELVGRPVDLNAVRAGLAGASWDGTAVVMFGPMLDGTMALDRQRVESSSLSLVEAGIATGLSLSTRKVGYGAPLVIDAQEHSDANVSLPSAVVVLEPTIQGIATAAEPSGSITPTATTIALVRLLASDEPTPKCGWVRLDQKAQVLSVKSIQWSAACSASATIK